MTAMIKRVTFTITPERNKDGHFLTVEPTLENIHRANGGEGVLMSIAANCIRMVAKRRGLEKAIEMLNDFAMNDTSVVK